MHTHQMCTHTHAYMHNPTTHTRLSNDDQMWGSDVLSSVVFVVLDLSLSGSVTLTTASLFTSVSLSHFTLKTKEIRT